MNKRIIGILTVICLVASCFNFSVVASANNNYSDAIETLIGLNFDIPDDENAIISRAEFAGIISDIYNYNSRPQPCNGKFSDVTKANIYSGAIYDLVGRGVISGFSETTFKPDEPILFEQAVKILIKALGYDILAEEKGGYPTGYVLCANEIKMLKGVSKESGETLTCAEMAQLIFNALETDILIQSAYGTNNDYVVRENVNLMTEYMKIRKVSGVIKDNGITSLTGVSRVTRNRIILNGNTYNAKSSGACSFLGYNVDAYVTMREDGIAEDVVYVRPNSISRSITIKADRLMVNDPDFSVTNIVYEDINGKRTKEKIYHGADFIYNGKAHVDLRVNDLKIPYGELVLIDNTGDGVFEIVLVKNARVVVVDGVSLNTNTIYDKNSADPLKLDETDEFNITKNLEKIELADVKEWDVATAYISLDKKQMDIDISTAKVTGVVKMAQNDLWTIKVDDEYFHVSSSVVFEKIKLGEKYEFCIDNEGNIVAIKNNEQDVDNVGYFIDAAIDNTKMEHVVEFKVFTTRNEYAVYTCADKVKVDGDKNKTLQQIVDYLRTNADGKLINYKFNSDGKVCEIILPYVGADIPADQEGRLQLFFDSQGEYVVFHANQQSFAGKIVLTDNAKVFQIPTDRTNYEDYSIRNASYFGNLNGFVVQAYKIGEEDGRADFVIHNANSTPTYSTNTYPVLVSKIVSEIDEDGNGRECLYAYGHQGLVRYFAETDNLFKNSGIKKGDIVRCPLNIQGRAISVRKVYSVDSKTIVSAEDNGLDFFASCRSFAGDVFSKYNTLVGITTYDMSIATPAQAKSNLELHNISSAKIYTVDTNAREEITLASKEEIYDYLRVGNECSKVYLYSYDGNPRMLVVYKK